MFRDKDIVCKVKYSQQMTNFRESMRNNLILFVAHHQSRKMDASDNSDGDKDGQVNNNNNKRI